MHPTLEAIARTHGKTVAQIIWRWHIEIGNIVHPQIIIGGAYG